MDAVDGFARLFEFRQRYGHGIGGSATRMNTEFSYGRTGASRFCGTRRAHSFFGRDFSERESFACNRSITGEILFLMAGILRRQRCVALSRYGRVTRRLEGAKASAFFEQCSLPDLLPEISGQTKSWRSICSEIHGRCFVLGAVCLLAATNTVAQGWQHIGNVQRVTKLSDGVELLAGKTK